MKCEVTITFDDVALELAEVVDRVSYLIVGEMGDTDAVISSRRAPQLAADEIERLRAELGPMPCGCPTSRFIHMRRGCKVHAVFSTSDW